MQFSKRTRILITIVVATLALYAVGWPYVEAFFTRYF
jgi:hypothetical protein